MSVERYIDDLPEDARNGLLGLRDIIRSAAEVSGTAPLEENLKWGQPSFAPPKRKGTPIRLSWSQKTPDRVEVLVHCQTTLVDTWRHMFGDAFDFDGTRAVHLPLDKPLQKDALFQMATMALTYHQNKA